MTFKQIVLFLLIIITSIELSSQNAKITVNGTVRDRSTNEPLPFAHIQFASIGTVTNAEGNFSINIIAEPHYIKASYMGFITDSVLITGDADDVDIKLMPSVVQMKEVMVLTGEGIVKNLISKIYQNYQNQQQMWQAYYKEKLVDGRGPIYLAEGILDVYYPGSSIKYDWQISAIKSRKKTFQPNNELNGAKLTGNAHDMVQNLIWGDYTFLTTQRMKNFDCVYEGYTVLQGKNVYIVSFTPIAKKEDVRGRLYIEEESYALVKAVYEVDTRKSKEWETVEWEEEYQKIDDKWYFQRMGYRGRLKYNENNISLESMLVINDIKIVPHQPAMGLLLEPGDFFFDEVSQFTDDFWEDYLYVMLEKNEKYITK